MSAVAQSARLLHVIQQRDDHELRLRSRNQNVRRDFEIERIELAVADEIGDRRAGGAAADQFAKRGAGFFVGRLAVRRVEIDPPAAAGCGEQHFGVEPRILGAVLAEILDRPRAAADRSSKARREWS